MFAIQPINRFYKNVRYVGIRKETNLPYLVYEGNPDCPRDIHDFGTLESAIEYLTKFINRENINVSELSTSQMVDIALVNNSNKFDIIEYHIEDDKIKVINTYPQSQFNRKDWY